MPIDFSRYTSTNLPPRHKTVDMTFKKQELVYDIKNYAYVEGDVMDAQLQHAKHQTQDICEEGNIDRVTRILDLAYAECVEALYPYTKEIVDDETSLDNTPSDSCEHPQRPWDSQPQEIYKIRLLVPDDYSKTTLNLLVKYIHEYMVSRVLADWFSITNPTSAANWKLKETEMKDNIHEAVNFRVKRVRRTQTPF